MKLRISHFAQIEEASLDFGHAGDLTILLGQQATGKSLILQWLKLLTDTQSVRADWDRFAPNWKTADPGRPLDLFFGEGLAQGWHEGRSGVWLDGHARPLQRLFHRKGGRQTSPANASETTYFIPAHRALLLSDGWPRFFQQHAPGTPYVARAYSERLARWLADAGNSVFPVSNRLQQDLRRKFDEAIFHRASLDVDRSTAQNRLILKAGDSRIPFMAWTAGQREFVPLLIALYELMPAGRVSRLDHIETVILEEPELGLHPQGLHVVGLAVLALLQRGYRVVVSTHSPLLGDFAWSINRLRIAHKHGLAGTTTVRKAFGLGASVANDQIAQAVLKCRARTYHLAYSGSTVHSTDISSLRVSSENPNEASWGGLLEHSSTLAEVVANLELDPELIAEDFKS